MAAPKKVMIIYEDGTQGRVLSGIGTGYDTWSWWTQIKQTEEVGSASSKCRYVDTVEEGSGKKILRYNLYCKTYNVRLKCDKQEEFELIVAVTA